jgi:hypothetical protein
MAKVTLPQALTANRLTTGDVVYWRAGTWVDGFAEAEIFPDPALADAALKAAEAFVTARVVVNPYLFPVRVEADGAHPVEERELIRAAGPSVRHDLGKQAEAAGRRHV